MEQLRVGLVGYGLAGRVFHAPLVAATDGLVLDAVVTRNPERVRQCSAQHPGATVVGSVADLLRRRPDVVVVASPNDQHVPHALAALAADAFVVVDKPVAVSLAEAERLVAAAPAGRLTVFQNRRFDDDVLTLRRLLDAGDLGRVHRFESRFERWRPTAADGAWREQRRPEAGGGLLLDLGSHLVDQARSLFGPVTSVYAEVRTLRAGVAADDDCFIALAHAGGTVSHLSVGAVSAHLGERLRVLGDRAAFVTRGLDPQGQALAEGRRPGAGWLPARFGWLGSVDSFTEPLLGPGDYAAFYRAVAAAAVGADFVPVEPTDTLAVMAVLDAARRSADRQEVVVPVIA